MIPALLALVLSPGPGCVQVAEQHILVRHLVSAAPALAALPQEEVLGYAPAPGARRVVSRHELARLAERHGVRLEPVPSLCVERVTRRLTREEVAEALRAVLKERTPAGTPVPQVEVLDVSRYPAPEGELEFTPAGLPAPPRASTPVIWRGRVRYAGNRSTPVWARVRLSVSGEAVLAAEDLSASRPIQAAQVRLAKVEWFPFSEAPARDLEQVVGRLPRRAIRAGTPVLASALMLARQVGRGETVTVEVVSGAAQLRLRARAETSGSAGEAVLVRNPASGRLFAARVEGEGKVVVDADSQTGGSGGLAGVRDGAGRRAR